MKHGMAPRIEVLLAAVLFSTGGAAILLLIEPVLNPVWAFLVHGETPAGGAVAGSALILAGTVIKTWQDKRANARKTE